MRYIDGNFFGSVGSGIILSRLTCDFRRDMNWWMDLLTTSTHGSELQVITALPLICTVYKSLHPKSSPACSVFTSRCLVTTLNSWDSSASCAQVLTSLPSVRNSTHNWLSGWRPFHTNLLDFSSQADFQLNVLDTDHIENTSRFHCCSSTVAAA
jgi:hypothetical protein